MKHRGNYDPEYRQALIIGIFTLIVISILIIAFVMHQAAR